MFMPHKEGKQEATKGDAAHAQKHTEQAMEALYKFIRGPGMKFSSLQYFR